MGRRYVLWLQMNAHAIVHIVRTAHSGEMTTMAVVFPEDEELHGLA